MNKKLAKWWDGGGFSLLVPGRKPALGFIAMVLFISAPLGFWFHNLWYAGLIIGIFGLYCDEQWLKYYNQTTLNTFQNKEVIG